MATIEFKINLHDPSMGTLFFLEKGIESSVPICSKEEGRGNLLFLLRHKMITQEEYDRVMKIIDSSDLPESDPEDSEDNNVFSIPVEETDTLRDTQPSLFKLFIWGSESRDPLNNVVHLN